MTAVEDARAAVFARLDFLGLIETHARVALTVTCTLLCCSRAPLRPAGRAHHLSASGASTPSHSLAGEDQAIRPSALARKKVWQNSTRDGRDHHALNGAA